MSYKKIISVILSVLIILHPFTLFAETTATSSAQIDVSPSPADEDTQSDDLTATQSAEIADTTVNTDGSSQQNTTESAQLDQETENQNAADVINTIDSESSTGENITENNIISEINTGDASASANVITEANNNIQGEDIHQDIINITEDNTGDIDLSYKPLCQDMSDAAQHDIAKLNTGENTDVLKEYKKTLYETIYNSNKAKIINNVTLIAATGDNSSNDIIGTIDTGDASVLLNVFNMVNTNLIGNCGYFGVINVYGDQTGDIILPYELGYIGEDAFSDETSQNRITNTGDDFLGGINSVNNSSDSISNTNDATIQNNIETDANSGGNSATGYSQIQTGTALSNIRIADTANTNIIGDRWVLVLVNYYGSWDGQVEGWNGNIDEKPQSVLMWVQLPSENSPQSVLSGQIQNTGDDSSTLVNSEVSSEELVQNENEAAVESNFNLSADTGNNSSEGRLSDIKTGNASITVNQATIANTNIIGKNWFFAIINIFGNFVGNIIFPRPDVAVHVSADKLSAEPGEDITYTISYANIGRYKAENVNVSSVLPPHVKLLSYSDGGSADNNSVSWAVGTLAPGQSATVQVVATISDTENSVVNTASISTTTDEPNKSNNSSSVVTQIQKSAAPATPVHDEVNDSKLDIESGSSAPEITYEQNSNPVTHAEVADLFAQKNSELETEARTKTVVLAARDTAEPKKDSSVPHICLLHGALCTGFGAAVLPVIYLLLKRKKIFQWVSHKTLLKI